MAIIYELAKELKEAGFPFEQHVPVLGEDINGNPVELDEFVVGRYPTLSELIEACGDEFNNLTYLNNEWMCNFFSDDVGESWDSVGSTPEEAVARLWLALRDRE